MPSCGPADSPGGAPIAEATGAPPPSLARACAQEGRQGPTEAVAPAPPLRPARRWRSLSPNCQRAGAAPHRRPFRAGAGHAAESQGRGAPPSTTPTKGDKPRAATAPRPSQSQARRNPSTALSALLGPPPPCGKGRDRATGRTGRTGQTSRTGRTDRTAPSDLSHPPRASTPHRACPAPRVRLTWRLAQAATAMRGRCQRRRRLGAGAEARRCPARNRQKRHRESFLLFRTPPGRCDGNLWLS
jgi:hypothetical protein